MNNNFLKNIFLIFKYIINNNVNKEDIKEFSHIIKIIFSDKKQFGIYEDTINEIQSDNEDNYEQSEQDNKTK